MSTQHGRQGNEIHYRNHQIALRTLLRWWSGERSASFSRTQIVHVIFSLGLQPTFKLKHPRIASSQELINIYSSPPNRESPLSFPNPILISLYYYTVTSLSRIKVPIQFRQSLSLSACMDPTPSVHYLRETFGFAGIQSTSET